MGGSRCSRILLLIAVVPQTRQDHGISGDPRLHPGAEAVLVRMIGLFPILPSYVFDIVSSGQEFQTVDSI
jgi:hypothetical protein